MFALNDYTFVYMIYPSLYIYGLYTYRVFHLHDNQLRIVVGLGGSYKKKKKSHLK